MVSERNMERAIAWAAKYVPSVDVSTEGLEAFAEELDEQHVRTAEKISKKADKDSARFVSKRSWVRIELENFAEWCRRTRDGEPS